VLAVVDTPALPNQPVDVDQIKLDKQKKKKSSVHSVSTVHRAYTSSWCVP
jgi:hypothetical protein